MAFIDISELNKQLDKLQKYWIVFTGDSITSCEWVHPNWRDIVIYVLQTEMTKFRKGDWQLPEWRIKGFNFAYDGATTADIVAKLDDILFVKPQLVIGLMGNNDPTLGISISDSVSNIKKITQVVIKSGSKLVWCNSTSAATGSDKNDQYEPYAKAFMAIPDQPGFFKIDMFNLYQQFPTEKFFTFKSEENPVEGIKAGDPDPWHPNQLGNAYIAKVVLDQVFGINFDPDEYIRDTLAGEKLPSY